YAPPATARSIATPPSHTILFCICAGRARRGPRRTARSFATASRGTVPAAAPTAPPAVHWMGNRVPRAWETAFPAPLRVQSASIGAVEASGTAFGQPGIEPRWTAGAKDAVGTAYSASSHLWFTITRGVITEIYYPTIDTPQVRDVQFLVTDGETFAHDEKRHHTHTIEKIAPDALGFHIVGTARGGRYRLIKEVIADPHAPCLLLRVQLASDDETLARKPQLYLLVAPHLDGHGWGDSAAVRTAAGRPVLAAWDARTWLLVGANAPLGRRSVG